LKLTPQPLQALGAGSLLFRFDHARLSQSYACPTPILRDELDTGLFQGFPQFGNCPFLCSERTRLGFEALHAGKRHSGSFGKVTLLPPKKGPRRSNLLTRQRQFNTPGIDMSGVTV
jgi:hypothetical protein